MSSRPSLLMVMLCAGGMLGPMAAPCQAQVETVQISVPAGVSFAVTNVSTTTTGSPAPTTITYSAGTWPPPNGKKFEISVRADSASFSAPSGSAIPAASVSWTASASAGTAFAGTLSSAAYTQVYRSPANAPAGSVSVTWTLAALSGISALRAGSHTMTVRWRLELQ